MNKFVHSPSYDTHAVHRRDVRTGISLFSFSLYRFIVLFLTIFYLIRVDDRDQIAPFLVVRRGH